jgi:hypothetical protein
VGVRLFLVVPAPVDEKWACLDDGPVLRETLEELPPIKLDKRWWVGNVEGDRAWPTKPPSYLVLVDLYVWQISLFRFEWPVQHGNARLINVPICFAGQLEDLRRGREKYAKSGLPEVENIVTNLLRAIQSFEASFNKTPEERSAWELVKEMLCLRLAHLEQEEELLYGRYYRVRARDVLIKKRLFFGEDARLEHPRWSSAGSPAPSSPPVEPVDASPGGEGPTSSADPRNASVSDHRAR